MISTFFIDRPRFAMVIAVVTILAGLLALTQIPVAQFPQITPPEVQVTASYPGANAAVLVDSVGGPIEEQVNGVENMLYMSSSSTNNGGYSLTVTFAVGTDPAIAQVNVQNRVALALPRLPQTVTQTGVSVRTRSSNMLLAVAIYSPRATHDDIFVSNYASINVRDALARLPGVGDATIFGPVYSMRVWMNPDQMQSFGITAQDLSAAIQSQNAQASAGQIGSPPSVSGQQLQLTVVAKGRLATPDEFGNIVVRTNQNGGIVRVRDVARVELGAQAYDTTSTLNGQPSATIVIYQSPEGNALAVSRAVGAELRRLAGQFPDDLSYTVVFDATDFVRETIREIFVTLLITFALVVAVTYAFLQDWRATLIPTVAIPVAIIGAFAVLYLVGYSANTVTLFALILAISLVVDDAIIIVENVQSHLALDRELSVAAATRRSMEQLTGPIIATTLVLAAVFVPVTLLSGITGQLYRQFAVTILVTVTLSTINALTLSPALCSLVLRPPSAERQRVFQILNRGLETSRDWYLGLVGRFARRLSLTAVALVLIFAGVWGLFRTLPSAFVPAEDQGYFFVNVQLPNAASLERTSKVLAEIVDTLRQNDEVADVIGISGTSLLGGSGSEAGMAIAALKPWRERRDASAILGELRARFTRFPAATIVPFNPPAIPGLGSTGGFDFRLQARGGQTPQDLAEVMRGLIVHANQRPELTGVFSTFSAAVPQTNLDIDRDRAEHLGVSAGAIFDTMQAHLGSAYVGDFNIFSRVYQVRLQDEARFRTSTEDIERLHVRGRDGQLVPLGGVVHVSTTLGPNAIGRYNLFPTAAINGQPAAGASTGQALAAMEAVAGTDLPAGYGFEWTGLALQEREAGAQIAIIFALGIVFTYLFLVAQYESWSVPIAVMLSVSLGVMGALAALLVARMNLDLYGQIGLVLLVGLSAKNAILIVEFAKVRREAGFGTEEAALAGTGERFRPVLMTALSSILGVIPLLIATGAGAASRRSIGVTVFGGLLLATLVGLLLIPLLYVLVQSARERLKARLFGQEADHVAARHPAELDGAQLGSES